MSLSDHRECQCKDNYRHSDSHSRGCYLGRRTSARVLGRTNPAHRTDDRIASMLPLQEYIEHADEHFQSVLAERDRWLLSGTLHEMPAELRALVDKGFLYHNAKKIADDRRQN